MSFSTYAHYKDSGVEWLGEVPAHWDVKSIKWISPVSRGASPRPIDDQKYFDPDGEYAWVRIADASASDGVLVETTQRLSALGSSLSVKLEPGQLFISIAGTVGKPCITGIKACIHDGFVYFPKLGIDPKFLYRIFEAGDCYAGLGKMGTQLNLNTDTIGSIRIAVPPTQELAQLLRFIDRETSKLDALITEQRTLIDLLKEKRQAVISHAVTKGLDPRVAMKDSGVEWLGEVPAHWDVTKAGRYLSILPGYAFPSADFSLDEVNTKLLRGINVGVSKIKWDETVYWRRFDGDGLDAFELADGDIVIGMDRPYISEGMRVARISEADLPCLLLQRVAAIRASGKLSDDQILLLLSSSMFLDHFSPETTGVSVPHISPSQISEFIVPIPPLAEQKKIFKWIEVEATRIDDLTVEAQTTIALLQERRSALISAAVTGKIDVRLAA